MKEDTTSSLTATPGNRRVQMGDIVTIDLTLVPENSFVPEPLMDTSGRISFVVGWGNYLPGLHELVQGCVGDSSVVVESVSIDAGYGHHDPDLVLTIPKHKMKKFDLRIGSVLDLQGKYQVLVTDIQPDAIVVDANPPLAGTSYACSFTVRNVEPLPPLKYVEENISSVYQVSTFALGCFWGAELAYMRTPGVVGTKVGYAHNKDGQPSRESVMVVYDSRIVSYDQLLQVAMDRLAETNTTVLVGTLFQQQEEDEDSYCYKHGFYYHTESQRQVAARLLSQKNRFGIELLKLSRFDEAEEFHQQYLYKGGQSARKGAKEKIRCYG